MIKINISELLGKYKKNQAWLCRETGIRPAQMTKWYAETVQRVEIKHLDAIVKAFRQLDDTITLKDVVVWQED